ncbi:MAG: molybdopterin-dependent oxidoreductase [Gemmataceae bacterium]
MNPKLQKLIQWLDRLHGRAPLDQLEALLVELGITCDDVQEYVHFSEASYRRTLVHAGDWYHVWIMCWKNGQRSPIHDHSHSSCALQVLRGTLTESRFVFAANGHVKAVSSREIQAGGICAAQDTDLHQASNLQPGSEDLVTLHVYSPPLLRMATYSILDRTRGEDVWLEQRRFITDAPENSEMPLEVVHSWVTPNRLFFVRNHFAVPALEAARWKLRLEGNVRQAMEWSFEELTALPERSVFATIECAGNGRSFLSPPAPGVQWGAGAIGHAEWTGVPVRLLLEQAGVYPGAVEVLFEGADQGSEADHPETMNFARSLPLAKAMHPDTLLAYRMNGELLAPAHGYPVRLFVPGWYGVASVKWVQKISVIDEPFAGYYQNKKYTIQRRRPEGLVKEVVGAMPVKAELIRPTPGSVLGLGMNRLFGVAWAGEEAVLKVEVSTDGGAHWSEADLLGHPVPYSWTLWEYLWESAQPGEYNLLVRATSTSGRTQPTQYDPLYKGYMIHFVRPTNVRIEAERRVPVGASGRDVESMLYDMNAYAEENARMSLDVELSFSGGEGI